MKKQDFFCHIFIIGGISIGGGLLAPLATPMIVTSMLFVVLRFEIFFVCLPLCACQSDTNGFILCDHAKYVMLLVKGKIVLNNSCNLKLSRTKFQLF